ncbi:MAG: hypothetical protein E4G90_09490 [Gemmatimonadales bacterium]|nr:MAG: hypothetical protein E4G90_09490 [Gemmatimonadales bacterium]
MIIGIDPGVKGGMALLTPGGEVVETISFDGMKEKELAFAFSTWKDITSPSAPPEVWLEKVGYIRGDGGKGSFTFGRIAGLLAGLSWGCGWEPKYVYPMMWQSALGCLTGGNKNVSKARAQQLFPTLTITHATADALLLAEFGRRVFGGRGK